MKKQSRKILKVGFDLDGVLLYNPARIFRPLIAFIKNIFFNHQQMLTFYYPKTKLEKWLWWFFHKSSLFVADGFEEINNLVQQKKIKAYLITARYSFLKKDLDQWLKRMKIDHYFSGIYYNKNDEQPHLFKEKLIKKLNLDIFVEDNWDIVKYLNQKSKSKEQKYKIFWIYNIFDRKIKYHLKYPQLKSALASIKKNFLEEKSKILIVSDYFYPHWTGISKSIYNLTLSLRDKFDFTILTVKFKKNLKERDNLGNIKIIRKKYQFPLSRAKVSLSLIFTFLRIVKDYDIILLNSPLSSIFPLSFMIKIFGKKLFIFHQGDLILPKGTINWLIERIFDISTLTAFLLADKVSTYTKDYGLHSRVLRHFQKKFTPLMIPLIITAKKNNQQNIVYKKLKNLKKKKKILFGFGGRFVEEKGFDILLKTIPIVIKKNQNIHFVFAGKTKISYEKTFENLQKEISILKQHITFLGLLNNNQLVNFYQMIDFIVIPSRSDCFNLIQAEAMIFKKPSIVSNIPGASYLVKNTGFGLIFEKEDAYDLAQKLIHAIRIKKELQKKYPILLKILDYKNNVEKAEKYFRQ